MVKTSGHKNKAHLVPLSSLMHNYAARTMFCQALFFDSSFRRDFHNVTNYWEFGSTFLGHNGPNTLAAPVANVTDRVRFEVDLAVDPQYTESMCATFGRHDEYFSNQVGVGKGSIGKLGTESAAFDFDIPQPLQHSKLGAAIQNVLNKTKGTLIESAASKDYNNGMNPQSHDHRATL